MQGLKPGDNDADRCHIRDIPSHDKMLQAMYDGDECSVGKATIVAAEEGCKVCFI